MTCRRCLGHGGFEELLKFETKFEKIENKNPRFIIGSVPVKKQRPEVSC
jgi:hypothetical protein